MIRAIARKSIKLSINGSETGCFLSNIFILMFRDNEVGRSTTSPLAGEVSAGDPGANAQGPGDASTTDEPPTQLVHGQTTIGQKPGGFRGGGGFLSAQCPPH
jgi:hypothetical protein